jgi:hypothetical protein
MAKRTYTSPEAWAIFFGGLIVGVVFTSFFWAYTSIPEEVKQIQQEAKDATTIELTRPVEFIKFCEGLSGRVEWDSEGYRSCSIDTTEDEKDVVAMSVFCKKFNLTISYGSYGVRCHSEEAE